MADLYDHLSPAQQVAFRLKLAGQIDPAKCPTVDLAGIAGADSLADPSNRGIAIDCFQQSVPGGVGSSGPGVLDQATYQAIMSGGAGGWGSLPGWEKAAIVAAGIFAALSLFRKKGRSRR
jgi:hypothetical protein